MQPDRDEVYLEWLAAAPKGVRWDKAQEMWEEYQRKCKEQADAVAKRLLGKQAKYECPVCFGDGTGNNGYCMRCSEKDENGN